MEVGKGFSDCKNLESNVTIETKSPQKKKEGHYARGKGTDLCRNGKKSPEGA